MIQKKRPPKMGLQKWTNPKKWHSQECKTDSQVPTRSNGWDLVSEKVAFSFFSLFQYQRAEQVSIHVNKTTTASTAKGMYEKNGRWKSIVAWASISGRWSAESWAPRCSATTCSGNLWTCWSSLSPRRVPEESTFRTTPIAASRNPNRRAWLLNSRSSAELRSWKPVYRCFFF